jgi:PAS domain S-box-containing protein
MNWPEPLQRAAPARGWVGGICLLVGAAAMLVLLGWALGIEALKRLSPAWVAMNPMTALMFLLGATALWLQRDPAAGLRAAGETASANHQRLARVLAVAVATVGAVKLGEHFAGWPPAIDQWLFPQQLLQDGDFARNEMAPNTAWLFVLAGLALALLDLGARSGRRPSEWLAATAALIALVVVLGYAYRVESMYGVGQFIPMALHTALLFLLLASGVLLARPQVGIAALFAGHRTSSRIARRLLAGSLLLVAGMGWLRLEGERAGLYGSEMGVTLYTTVMAALLALLVIGTARALQRAGAGRDAALALNRLVMDNSLDVICVIDAQGRFVQVSAASRQLWGYAPEELVGGSYADLVHPDDRAKTEAVANVILSGQPVLDFCNRYLRKDGSTVENDWTAVWSEPDRMMFCVARDAAPRRQAEELLLEREAQTRAIIDTASDAFVAIDRFGMVIDWNASAQRTFGWMRKEVLGRRLSETIIPPQHRRAHDQGLDHYLATGEGPVLNKPIEISAMHRDGHEFPVELVIWPLTAGQATTFNAFIRDISQRRRAEAMQARLAAIVASSDDAIVSKTLDGVITSWNPGAERIFGFTADDAVGQPMAMLFPSELAGEEADILARIARGESVEHLETVRVRKDGRRIDVAVTISPIEEAGIVVGASTIARDITERRRADQRIHELNEEMQQANRELEAFSYTISHDLRAPLRHIDGYARMLQEDAGDRLDGDARRYLDEIGVAARHMGTLIDDLLAFSRLGRKTVERMEVDMDALLERVVQEAGAAGDGRVNVEPLPPVQADPVLLRQVWVNLVSNALKYSAPRGNDARIEITGERDGAVLRYRIRDNGVGFDMRYADKLFGVFQRLHAQEEFEGTGVGLAIVQRIVSRHGGSIGAESELGKGATFSIDLPDVDPDADEVQDREMRDEQ